MRRVTHLCMAMTAFASLMVCVGCEKPAPPAPVPATKVPDDHADHESGDHQHGDHDHAAEGPHHGQIIELGEEEYHAELVHDEDTHTITVYLLDHSAEKSAASSAKEATINLLVDGKPHQFTLPAAPQADDSAGETSRYQLADEKLCETLDSAGAKGRLNVTIADKSYVGQLDHAAHEHHDHDHEK